MLPQISSCGLLVNAQPGKRLMRAERDDREGGAGGDDLRGYAGVEIVQVQTTEARDLDGVELVFEFRVALGHLSEERVRPEAYGDHSDVQSQPDCVLLECVGTRE